MYLQLDAVYKPKRVFKNWKTYPMNKIMIVFAILMASYLPSSACGCFYYPQTFCESIGNYESVVALVRVRAIGYLIPNENYPYDRDYYLDVQVIEDLSGTMVADTARVFLDNGSNCAANFFAPVGDSLLFNLERISLQQDPPEYILPACGLHFLDYRRDSLFSSYSSIHYNIPAMPFDTFRHYLSECLSFRPTSNLTGIIINVKTREAMIDYQFKANDELIQTDSAGSYLHRLAQVDYLQLEPVQFVKKDELLREISGLDLVKIIQHIRNIEEFSETWQYFAADVDNSKTISILDVIYLQRLILGFEDEVMQERSAWIVAEWELDQWREGINPFQDDCRCFNERHFLGEDEEEIRRGIADFNLVAIKLGDVI